MPKGDRTGPMGAGVTGLRWAGYCAGLDIPGYANSAASAGFGVRRGRKCGGWGGPSASGRGWRHLSIATSRKGRMFFSRRSSSPRAFNPELEKKSLRNRSLALQSELKAVNQRVADIESQ